MNNLPTILHVDINSYFATLLQQENPFLRGKPIGIVKEAGRTIFIAASKEAKTFGVKTGCHIKEAKALCPQIQAIPTSFTRYLDATKRLQKVFTRLAPQVHLFSLDEAFIDLTDCRRYFHPDPHHFARTIHEQIKAELGEWVTCTVGISHTRLLAKIASEISPPDSTFEITPDSADAILASVKFQDVCGVGYRLEKKLKSLGITNPYLIRFSSTQELQRAVGPYWAIELQKISHGQDPHFLATHDRPQPHMKSIGRSITGWRLANSETEIQRVIYNLSEEVIHKVRRLDLAGRQPYLKLYGQDQSWHAYLTLKHHIRHTSELFQILYHQLYRSWRRTFPVIKFAVRLGLLEPMTQVTPSLLPDWQQQEKLSAATDAITQKFGLFAIRSGLMTDKNILIRPEVTGWLGDKEYQLSDWT